jgi:hypothetical protein
MNGFGDHRIEGIGDKHVPWVHNVRNTDAIAAIDDEDCMRILRLFNEPAGKAYLAELGVDKATIEQLGLLGISGVCNMLAAIKAAKYWELNENDVIFTIFTDSVEMYRSRLEEQTAANGAFTSVSAAKAQVGSLERQGVDNFKELTFPEKKAIHNLKYYLGRAAGQDLRRDLRPVGTRVLDPAVHRGGRCLRPADREVQSGSGAVLGQSPQPTVESLVQVPIGARIRLSVFFFQAF